MDEFSVVVGFMVALWLINRLKMVADKKHKEIGETLFEWKCQTLPFSEVQEEFRNLPESYYKKGAEKAIAKFRASRHVDNRGDLPNDGSTGEN